MPDTTGFSFARTGLQQAMIDALGIGGDYNLEVLRGNVAGHSMVSVIAHDESLTTTRVVITPEGGTDTIDQSAIHSTPATVILSSTDADDTSAGAGLRSVLIIGLDSSGAPATEVVAMNGQTGTTSSNTWSAINSFRGLTWGASLTSEGTIWIGNGSLTAGVPATRYFSAEAGFNKGMTGYYTIPTATTLFLRAFTISLSETGKAVEVTVESSANGINWITENVFGAESGPPFQGTVRAVPGLAAGTHLRIRGVVSVGTAHTNVVLGFELVDD